MKKQFVRISWLFIISLTLIFINQGCEKDEDWDLVANKELIKVMKEYYLWYDQMPTVKAGDYKNPKELMEVLRVNPPDRWSYITTKQELDAYYTSGAYYGFGFGNAFDQDGKLWILYVFTSSPLAQNGVTRGWIIEKIDDSTPTPENYSQLIGPNEAGLSKKFQFLTPSGEHVTYTYTKTQITMNTVLFDSTYTFGQTKVGYLVLKGFIDPTVGELNDCFTRFKNAGVNELIIDFRYNGGGLIDVSNYLASLIGGTKTNGKVFAAYHHNDKNTFRNDSVNFLNPTNSLSLDRVIFITTNGTASASELVINGLKPFLPSVLVGSPTHGKPAGMYSFKYKEFDWAFVPICFTLRNALDQGDYYNGIPVDFPAEDDVSRRFGDVNESSLNTCLGYLGVIGTKGLKSSVSISKQVSGKGLYEEIGAW